MTNDHVKVIEEVDSSDLVEISYGDGFLSLAEERGVTPEQLYDWLETGIVPGRIKRIQAIEKSKAARELLIEKQSKYSSSKPLYRVKFIETTNNNFREVKVTHEEMNAAYAKLREKYLELETALYEELKPKRKKTFGENLRDAIKSVIKFPVKVFRKMVEAFEKFIYE
jgi:hypothetical protein